jgi:hypothetical protein
MEARDDWDNLDGGEWGWKRYGELMVNGEEFVKLKSLKSL